MLLELVILEDDERRRAAMTARWTERHPQHPIRVFATAAETVRHLGLHVDTTLAVSLDHDLEIIEGTDETRYDPGTGREVADFLAGREPRFPVVVASTNAPAATGMVTVLEESGWAVDRVVPYGDLEWVDEVWYPTLRRALRRTAAAPSGRECGGDAVTTKTLLTADEYLAMPEDGWSELVRGEVVELPPPGPRHGRVSQNVAFVLELWGRESGFGLAFTNDSAVQTEWEPDTVRGADVVFVSHDRVPDGVPVTKFDRPPNLVVEVISPSDTWPKVVKKIGEYLAADVDEVWVVDPEARWVERHTADGPSTRFAESEELRDSPSLPGFTTPVAEFFRNA